MKTLTELFTDIANALRDKKGTTEKIEALNFASEIKNLSGGGGDSENNAIIVVDGLKTNTNSSGSGNVLNQLLEKIPLIDTSGWTSTAFLFYRCHLLKEIPQINTSKVTNMQSMFSECNSLSKLNLNFLDTSNVTNMQGMFNNAENLEELDIGSWDISKVTNFSTMFNFCVKLKKIIYGDFKTDSATNVNNMFSNTLIENGPKLKGDKLTNINGIFNSCSTLTYWEGIENLGKAYTQKSKNFSTYTLSLSSSNNLTYTSLINIINNLYDLNLSYDVSNGGTLYAQSLILGSTNLSKLTEEEIAIATAKGWNVS